MSKVNLTDYASDNNIVVPANANNAAIEAAFENTLSRDGSTPNSMSAPLDMNSNRILNLPQPLGPNDPARLSDLTGVTLVSQALPTQVGQSGKSLSTNGSVLTWSNLPTYYATTAAETAAVVTPTNFSYPPGDVRRYGTNTTPGTTDMTAAGAGNIVTATNPFTWASTDVLNFQIRYKIHA